MTHDAVCGACLCGAVRFQVQPPALWVAHCHCTYCRRAHGAAFVTWAGFASDRFVLTGDSVPPTWYESSPGARRAFCPRCGSPMFFESTRWPGEVHVARALINADWGQAPSAHVFYETHVPWLQVGDDLPRRVSQAHLAAMASSAGDPP